MINIDSKSKENELTDCDLKQMDYGNKEIIKTHFFQDIAEYLNKRDKISLLSVSNNFVAEIFQFIQINLSLKNINKLILEHPNIRIHKILDSYKNIRTLDLVSLKFNSFETSLLEKVISNNSHLIERLNLTNLEFETQEDLEQVYRLLNKIPKIKELHIQGVSNRDRLILHLEKNSKRFNFFKFIEIIKIDNLPLSQILYLLEAFKGNKLKEIYIENCSLDEELSSVVNLLNSTISERLQVLSLSYNGLCSALALNSLKNIIDNMVNIRVLILRGLWFNSVLALRLTESLKNLKHLEKIDLFQSKYLFEDTYGIPSSFHLGFKNLCAVKILDLTDCGVRSSNLDKLLAEIENPHLLEELNLTKNYFNSEFSQVLLQHAVKLRNLRHLNISINARIGSKGINQLLQNLDHFKELRTLLMVSCGIYLKHIYTALISFAFAKKIFNLSKLEYIDLMLSSFSQKEFLSMIKDMESESNNSLSDKSAYEPIKLKLKFKRDITQCSFYEKAKTQLEMLYNRHDLTIK